jgi:hypothetical protein
MSSSCQNITDETSLTAINFADPFSSQPNITTHIAAPMRTIDSKTLESTVQGIRKQYYDARVAAQPASTKAGHATLQQKADEDLLERLQKEWCYYRRRYDFANKTVLPSAMASAQGSGTSQSNALKTTINKIAILDARMNYIVAFMQAFSNITLSDTTTKLLPQGNKTNAALESLAGNLDQDNQQLGTTKLQLDTNKQLVRFTEEKNRKKTMMIAFYSGLNVLAAGLVLYAYTLHA